ncbi:hypothetical protein [Actinomadura sp. DC4]|uniref:hypothetical protein n=1 Tax=Actinomadura sp. DC4 TaxID=3055069 RepID=UPI0025B272A3|nr:hypothetical protein [Actinomadura sp. DC4]MDN3356055.1 hypothetical protein [Actinomadura sp. DC4]
MSYPTPLSRVERDTRDERARQDAKWGEQNHDDGTGDQRWRDAANRVQLDVDEAARLGGTTWRGILHEEVFEAFAAMDPAKLRTELIQVAAVAQVWAEAIDRRGGDPA